MKTDEPRTVVADRYVLEREIGHGSLGVVWRAADRILDRTVAVKIVHRHLASDPRFARRLAERARAVAALSHPGLTRMLDTGTDGTTSFIVTELVDGESLRDVLSREGPLDPERAVTIAHSVLDSLAATHAAGVVHLDLKPENVLIGTDGRVRVSDAGVSLAACLPSTLDPGDPGIDIRATGAVLYEALTGRAPGPLGKPVVPARALHPGVPRSLDSVVMRALAERHEDRFQTADDFRRALPPDESEVPGGLLGLPANPQPRSATPPAPPGSWSAVFRGWLAVPLVLLVVVTVAIAVGLSVGRLEIGGPLGVRPKQEEVRSPTPEPRPVAIPIRSVSDYDPLGDDSENPSWAPLAIDGDAGTFWKSENYFDGRLNKPGVGLLFEIEPGRTVTGFRLITPAPGFRFQVLVGDDPVALVEAAGIEFTALEEIRRAIAPQQGQYALLWITSVVPTEDGNRAEVAEFKLLGPDG